MRVVFDIGHGGVDPGAVVYTEDGDLLREHEIAFEVGVNAIHLLVKHGVDPDDLRIFVVADGERMPIGERAKRLSDLSRDEDLVVSLHCNKASGEVSGAELFHHRKYGDKKLGDEFLHLYCESTGLKNRGVKKDSQTAVGGLGIMLYQPLAKKDDIILLELGFISNMHDVDRIRTKGAEGVARAVMHALGRKWEDVHHTVVFPDLPDDHFATKSILDLHNMGIVKGYSDGNFRPNQPITRAECAVMIDRAIKHLSKAKHSTSPHTAPRP